MNTEDSTPQEADADRRKFLTNAGRFVLVIPPAMTLLLSTTLDTGAIAASGGESKGKGKEKGKGKS